MTWVAIAVAGSAVVGAGVSVYSGNKAREQARQLAAQGAQAADPASAMRPEFQGILHGMWPQLSGVDYSSILSDPSFKFLHDTGMRDVTNAASASGTLRSGSLLEDMSRFTTGLSDTYINSQFQRNMALMGQLGNFSGLNTGQPGVAGQIMAGSGVNNFNMNSAVMQQAGQGIRLMGALRPNTGTTDPNVNGIPTDPAGNLQFDP